MAICTLNRPALVLLELAVCAMVVDGIVRSHKENGEDFAKKAFLRKSSVRYLPAQRLVRPLEVSPVLLDWGDVSVVAVGVVVASVVAGSFVSSAIANDTG